MATEQTNFRIDSEAKREAYAVLQRIGLKPTEAVNMFMNHIAMFGELPFQPRIPNAETLAALKEAESSDSFTTQSLADFKATLND
jgi:DNA-damage-inducible protein J